MIKLNLPDFDLKIKSKENKYFILDIIRKKYVVLTPEEWVRQNFLHFLIDHKKYPVSLIAVEKQLKINNLSKRTDILIFDKNAQPDIIVECKAPSVRISQDTFDQIARYNLNLKAKYLIITNGLQHYFAKMDQKEKKYEFLKDIPEYSK
jgi:hypothetical protein